MRLKPPFLSVPLLLLTALLVGACDFWPKNLEALAESVSRQVSGEATAWLVGGDVLLINVAHSPLYRAAQPELEASATGIAEQAIASAAAPLESVSITFHEGDVSDDPDRMREFIFLVMDDRPVLQPDIDLDITGPLTPDEIHAFADRLDESVIGERRECVLREIEERARVAGDPETLDPARVEFLSTLSPATWKALDAFGRRLILMQAITTKALFVCASAEKSEMTQGRTDLTIPRSSP